MDAGEPVELSSDLDVEQLGKVRGISTASAIRLAFRRKWRRQGGNDGTARVAVPLVEAKLQGRAASPVDRGDDIPTIKATLLRLQERKIARADRAEAEADRERAGPLQAEQRANKGERANEAERIRADQAEAALKQADRPLNRLAHLRAVLCGE